MPAETSVIYPDRATLVRATAENPVRVSVGQDTLHYGPAPGELSSTLAPGQTTVLTASSYIQTDGDGAVLIETFEPWAALERPGVPETVEGDVTFTGSADFTSATVVGLATAADLTTHTADTSSVHGITDTTALETTTGAQAKADAAAAASVAKTLADAKGDIFAASAADTVARLAVGTAGQQLRADSAQSSGIGWFTPRPIDPKSPAYGALFDNSTDDTTALEAAITAAGSSGGELIIPEGTAIVDDLDMVSGVTLRGFGLKSVLKQKVGGSKIIDVGAAVTDVAIRGVTFDGNSPNVTTANILNIEGLRVRIVDCDLYDADTIPVRITNAAVDVEVVNCRIRAVNATDSSGTSSHGIYLIGGDADDCPTNVKVIGCTIRDTGLGCIGGVGANGLEIIGNELADSGTSGDAIAIYPSPTSSGRYQIIGNVCRNNGNNGMHIGAVAGATIIGNTIENATNRGIALWSSLYNDNETDQASADYVIQGNRILDTTNEAGIELRRVTNAIVSGNVVRDAGLGGISIAASGGGEDEVIVSGNIVRDCASHGIDVRDSNNVIVAKNIVKGNASRGIVVGGTSDGVTVQGNRSTGNTTSQTRVQDSATNVRFVDNVLEGTLPFSNTGSGGPPLIQHTGTGTPESTYTALIGSTWRQTDGAVGSTLYVKESGTSTTGWSASGIGVYKVIERVGIGSITDALTAATYSPDRAGIPSIATVANGLQVFYFDPAEYAIAGRTLNLNLRATLTVNATAPAITFTFGLHPISAVVGAADTMTYTIDAAVSGSTAAFASPSASTRNTNTSTDFAAPVAGYYVFGMALSGTVAADSRLAAHVALRFHHV